VTKLLAVGIAVCSALMAFGGVTACGGEDEPEFRGPSGEESVEAFCAPLQFDPESTDPAGDLARRAVAVVDNSGTGADAGEAAESFRLITDGAPAEIREPAGVLGEAVSEALSSGDRSAIETTEAEQAIEAVNTWAATTCPAPRGSTGS